MKNRPTLFLLPGLLCDERVWEHQAASLASAFTVRIPVFRGFDSLERMAQHVLEQAPERFSVAGHSMGGRVALELLRLAGARIDGIVLMSLGAHPPAEGEGARYEALLALAESQGLEALLEALFVPMLHPDHRRDPGLLEALRAMLQCGNVADLRGQAKAALTRADQRAWLPAVRQNVLLLCGEADGWSPPSQHEDILRRLPHAELAVLPGAGHMLPMEAPGTVSDYLADWLPRYSAGENLTRSRPARG